MKIEEAEKREEENGYEACEVRLRNDDRWIMNEPKQSGEGRDRG